LQSQTALRLWNNLNKGINDAWNSIYSFLGYSEVCYLALIRQSHLDQCSTDYYCYPLSTSSQLGIILFNNQTPHNFNKENHATSPLANNTLASKVQLSKHHELSSAFIHHTRIMLQNGVSSLLCTYCFKRFTLRTWLHKHIEKDHPVYWAELRASKK